MQLVVIPDERLILPKREILRLDAKQRAVGQHKAPIERAIAVGIARALAG